MWGYYLLNIIIAVLVIIAVVQLLAALHAAQQGDAKWKVFFPGARRGEHKGYRRAVPQPPLVVTKVTPTEVTFTMEAVLRNIGRQQGTVMDCFPRAYLPREQYPSLRVDAFLSRADEPRDDGYWEAYLVPRKKEVAMNVVVTLRSSDGPIATAIGDLGEFPMDVIYNVYGRSDARYERTRFVVSGANLRQALLQEKGVR